MITLEAHRAVIGAFYGTTQHRKGIKAFNCHIKRVALWTTNDLNFILDQGDKIYKELNMSGMLSIQELPTTINSV